MIKCKLFGLKVKKKFQKFKCPNTFARHCINSKYCCACYRWHPLHGWASQRFSCFFKTSCSSDVHNSLCNTYLVAKTISEQLNTSLQLVINAVNDIRHMRLILACFASCAMTMMKNLSDSFFIEKCVGCRKAVVCFVFTIYLTPLLDF